MPIVILSIFQRLESMVDKNGYLPDTEVHVPGIQRGLDVRGLLPMGYDALWVDKELTERRARAVDKLASLLKAITRGQTKHFDTLRQAIMAEPVIAGILEHLPRSFMHFVVHNDKHLLSVARRLAYNDTDARCVKLGMVLLGMLGMKEDWPNVRILAMHEEFTYYAAFSIQGFSEEPAQALWELAKTTHANGRVIVVMMLTKYPLTQEIRDWLLIDGYRLKDYSPELAVYCAVLGELEDRVIGGADHHSGQLFAATEILNLSLVDDANQNELREAFGFPSPDFLIHFMRHAQTLRKPTYHLCLAMHRITDFLRRELDAHQVGRSQFPVDIALDLIQEITDYLSSRRARWERSFKTGLSLPTAGPWFKWALEGAERFGLDCKALLWRRIRQDAVEPSLWRMVAERADDTDVDRLMELGRQKLRLPKGFDDPEYAAIEGDGSEDLAAWVEVILMLARFSGKYPRFMEECLAFPAFPLRFAALDALSYWNKEHFTEAIRKQIDRLSRDEQLPYIRQLADKLRN